MAFAPVARSDAARPDPCHNTGMNDPASQILMFVGRLHPVVLHVPIGVLVALGVCEAVALVRGVRLDRAVRLTLIGLAAMAVLITAASGWLLSGESGYAESQTLTLHRWLGVGLAVGVLAAACAALAGRGRVYGTLLVLCLLVLGPAGHFGGVLTHGPGFLTEPFRSSREARPAIDLTAAVVSYETHIAAFLEAYCISCHGDSRKRGGLAMHTAQTLFEGGDYGPVVFAGQPELSELLTRMRLPIDDELRMPPSNRTQPTEDEIAMVERWIAEGLRLRP